MGLSLLATVQLYWHNGWFSALLNCTLMGAGAELRVRVVFAPIFVLSPDLANLQTDYCFSNLQASAGVKCSSSYRKEKKNNIRTFHFILEQDAER